MTKRSRPPVIARAALGLLVTGALVVATAGGVVFGGRLTDATRARADGLGRRAAGATPIELSSLGDVATEFLPPDVPPSTEAPAAAPIPAGPPFAVERLEFVVTDPSRGTPARGDEPTIEERVLRTVVRFPESRDGGPYPLVVFAHGYATSTAAYASLLDGIAAAGFVVAAPEFPLTSTAISSPVGDRDVAAQVGDVRFIISVVQNLARAPESPLSGRVMEGPVGMVGHSDGGVTAAATAFATQVRDARIGAAVVLSGARADFGGIWFPVGSPALLAIHGEADAVNPFGSSETLYAQDQSGAPRYLVAAKDAGHTDAFVGNRTRPWVVALIANFLRASLRGDESARAQIVYDASVAGALELVAADR